ncbi:hypothetical protein [Acinetobacter stercoris]|uniref:Uncharacterized protein n=1 Tax=Acinetobacter stercoris TaxID=2126983 RepID=A0A2U3N4M6_9GAMM|nr:hypothetical protein [Acinetobacter stercoris]SPL72660.1 hypothetical protein KPC_3838 [Acinetobacter stercoris]
MTFIIAIQLNDSIIVTADNRKIVLKETGEVQFRNEKSQKLYLWDEGIITGTGEGAVIDRSIELFKNLTHSEIKKLPQCLDISRQMRELEIGKDFFQVETTKLLCSRCNENGVQLYAIQRFEPSSPYTLTIIEPMDITVWLFHPNIETISADLQNLYADLKDYSTFANQTDWINYYINRLAPIYLKQSQQDLFMSQCFDAYFQTKDDYIFGHVSNKQNSTLEIKEISTKLSSI